MRRSASSSSASETDAARGQDQLQPQETASKKRKKREATHPVHQIIQYHEADNDSWCTVSGCTYKSPGNHAGNKMTHLESEHPEVHQNTLSEWQKIRGKTPGKSSGNKKPKCSLDKVIMSGPALQLHCLRLVTEHGLSFEVLEYQAFKDIIGPMLDAMPKKERPTISASVTPAQMSGLAARVRQKMAAEMEGRLMSMQIDGCSKGHRHFIGVNVQFIKEGKTVVRTLSVEELHVNSTAENLKGVLQKILRKFDVPPKNIVTVTSDNGANYLLAGKLLHVASKVQEEDLRDMVVEEDAWLDVDVGDEESVQSVRCAAHTLQLAVDDALGKDPRVKQTTSAVRELSKFLRKPNNYRQLQQAGKKLPLLDVVTRWGSTYDMLKSVVDLRHFASSVMDIDSQDRSQYFLTDEQWNAVDDLLADLFPVYNATIKLQARDLTLGELLAIWTEAVMELKSRRSALAKALLKSMDERAKAVMYKERARGERLSSLFNYPAFNASVFTDPRFFSLLSAEQTEEAKQYLVDLWQKLQLRRGVEVEPEPLDPAAETEDSGEEENAFGSFLAKKNKEREAAKSGTRSGSRSRRGRAGGSVEPQTSGRAKLLAMLEEYDTTTKSLPVKSDVLQFWEGKKLIWPELYEVAMIALAIPATQVSVERLFSSLRYILRPQRFKLGSCRVDDITFLHANADLLQEVAKDLLTEVMEISENEEDD